jgi:hypothetical protein
MSENRILFVNGQVFDGTGGPTGPGDVVVRGYRHHRLGVLGFMAPVNGQPFPPYLGQGTAHDGRRDQHVVGLPVDRLGQQFLLHLSRGGTPPRGAAARCSSVPARPVPVLPS